MDNKRLQIDELDQAIAELLEQRFMLCQQIGQIKKEQDYNVYDQNREEEIIKKIKANNFVFEAQIVVTYAKIFAESKRIQK